jgi:hypothetical protein
MKRGRKPFQDEFTKLNVSRQRKWQLRHPEASIELRHKAQRAYYYRNRKWRIELSKQYRIEGLL